MGDIFTNILVSAGTSFATKAIDAPIRTFNDIWDISLGNYFHALNDKSKIKHQVQIDDFKNKLAEDILKIAKEKLQEPKISIIGPALEASKYYFDEKEIRDMFVKLIASSMDSTYNGLVQHSFVEIIKQLSPYDAKLFASLNKVEPIVTFEKGFDYGYFRRVNPQGVYSSVNDFFYRNDYFKDLKLNEISINNLIRLGLLKIQKRVPMTDINEIMIATYYEKYEIEKSPTFEKSTLKITSFGQAFKDVCLKDSL